MKTKNKNHTNTELATPGETFGLQPATCDLVAPKLAKANHEPPLPQQVSIIARIQSPEPSAEHSSAPCIANLPTPTHPPVSCRHVRKGKIARLPKLARDMVNRMLHNHVPYHKIAEALEELDIQATERNISNWKTRGGYKEWCDEQERQLQLSHLQDHLIDYIRKNNATELPEVGLQLAATQLSLTLLQPDAARQLAADPEKYSRIVDMLCRLSTQISALQKGRDQAVKQASYHNTPEFIRREEEKEIENIRQTYTSEHSDSPHDPVILHRNDLPKRDELPYRDPEPKRPTFIEIMQHMHKEKGVS